MDGLYYLTWIIAILLVIGWYCLNDGVKAGDKTRGFLAMKIGGVKMKPVAKRRQREPWKMPNSDSGSR